MLIEKCRLCGSIAIRLNKITCGGYGYFVECLDCRAASKTRLFKKLAWREWNKMMKSVCCENCAKWGSDDCPNSAECYDLYYKPYFKEKSRIKRNYHV